MQSDDSTDRNGQHEVNSTEPEPTRADLLSDVREALTRPRNDDVHTVEPEIFAEAFVADGGQTFVLEGASEREWLTAEEPVEVVR